MKDKALKSLTGAQTQPALPVYVRPPTRGQEYFSGIGRSKLYDLKRRGKIRGISVRESGKDKGVMLFHLGSILSYIESQAE